MDARKHIGARLRTAREERGWSLRDMERIAGMAHTSWEAREKGETKIDFTDLENYAKLLGKPVRYFLPPQWIDPTGLDPEVARLAERINNLPEDVREAFEKLVDQAARASGLLKDEEQGDEG